MNDKSANVCVLFTKMSIDISHSLVHSHIYETSSQAVMGEDEQHSLQELIEFV